MGIRKRVVIFLEIYILIPERNTKNARGCCCGWRVVVYVNVVVVIVVVFNGNDVTKFCLRPRLVILETQPQHRDVLKTL